MPFAWSNKKIIIQVEQPNETIQYITIPVYDKISDIEHKNGKRLVNTRQKDNETHEIKGYIQEGGRPQEGNNGS